MSQRLEWLKDRKDVERYLFAQVLGNIAGAAYTNTQGYMHPDTIDKVVNVSYEIAKKAAEKLESESNTQET